MQIRIARPEQILAQSSILWHCYKIQDAAIWEGRAYASWENATRVFNRARPTKLVSTSRAGIHVRGRSFSSLQYGVDRHAYWPVGQLGFNVRARERNKVPYGISDRRPGILLLSTWTSSAIMDNQYCNPMQPAVSGDVRTLDAFSVVARPA